MPVFVDTNILLYSISRDKAEAPKREVALAILNRDDIVLSLQVLQEFYVQATRPTAKHAVSHKDAADIVFGLTRFEPLAIDYAVMSRALELQSDARISYWDAAIVAAAEAGRCETLLTEDLNDGQVIGRVRIKNPFLDV